MDDLAAFLRARLDEDEAAAKLAAGVSHAAQWVISEVNDDGTRDVYPANDDLAWVAGHIAGADAMHIARHDPARALREVAAKRALLKLAARADDEDAWLIADGIERDLAAVYSDCEGYRDEWRP